MLIVFGRGIFKMYFKFYSLIFHYFILLISADSCLLLLAIK